MRAVPEAERPELRRITTINHIRAMNIAAVEANGMALVPSYSVLPELERKLLVHLFPHIAACQGSQDVDVDGSRQRGLGTPHLPTPQIHETNLWPRSPAGFSPA